MSLCLPQAISPSPPAPYCSLSPTVLKGLKFDLKVKSHPMLNAYCFSVYIPAHVYLGYQVKPDLLYRKLVTHEVKFFLYEMHHKNYADSNTVCLLPFRKLAVASPERTSLIA